MPKVDNKQRDKMIDDILKDHPEYGADTLKRYYVEQMVESYLADSDGFNRKATDTEKEEKKRKKKGEIPSIPKIPEELVMIYKVGSEPKKASKLDTSPKFAVNDIGNVVVDLS
jgi:hypothetical protein